MQYYRLTLPLCMVLRLFSIRSFGEETVMTANTYPKIASDARKQIDRNEFAQAIKTLNPAIQEHPESHELRLLRAEAYLCWKSYAEAETDLKMVLADHPDMVDAYILLGTIREEQGLFDEALIEFQRAQHLRPDDLEVTARVLAANVSRGDLKGSLPKLEELHTKAPDNELVINYLAAIYCDLALENWHREPVDNDNEMICALSKNQVNLAEESLAKVRALPIQTDVVEHAKQDLDNAIKGANKRTYMGGLLSWIIPLLLIVMGFSAGGTWGWVYGISALAFLYANWRPQYVNNHMIYSNKADYSAVDRIMDFVGGDWLFFSNSISGVLLAKAQFLIFRNVLRVVLVSLFLPFATFSAFKKNYGWKHAGIFVGVVLFAGIASDSWQNYQQAKYRANVAALSESIAKSDFDKFGELAERHPVIVRQNRGRYLRSVINKDDVQAFEFLINFYEIDLQKTGAGYYKYAAQRKATKVMASLSEFKPITDKAASNIEIAPETETYRGDDSSKIPLKNASFESDQISANGWQFGVKSWNGVRHGVLTVAQPIFAADANQEGAQVAFLSKAGSWMSQTINLKPEAKVRYLLVASVALRNEPSFGSGSYEFRIYSGSQLLASRIFETGERGVFEDKQLSFILNDSAATSENYVLQIQNINARQISVDNIRFYAINEKSPSE